MVRQRIAALQINSSADVSENLERIAALLAQAGRRGAGLAVLPENFSLMPANDRDRLAAAEVPGAGPVQSFLAAQARELGMWLVAGTIPIAAEQGDKVRAACLVFDDQGRQVARYDKIHLFDVAVDAAEAYRESSHIDHGPISDNLVCADTPAGRLGLSVCYDLRFPELYRRLVADGAELFSIPAAFTETTGRAHWRTLVRARAIENLAYVVAPGQWGRHASGRSTFGHSTIVDPWGEVLGILERGDGVVVAEVDGGRQRALRRSFPALLHRRL